MRVRQWKSEWERMKKKWSQELDSVCECQRLNRDARHASTPSSSSPRIPFPQPHEVSFWRCRMNVYHGNCGNATENVNWVILVLLFSADVSFFLRILFSLFSFFYIFHSTFFLLCFSVELLPPFRELSLACCYCCCLDGCYCCSFVFAFSILLNFASSVHRFSFFSFHSFFLFVFFYFFFVCCCSLCFA